MKANNVRLALLVIGLLAASCVAAFQASPLFRTLGGGSSRGAPTGNDGGGGTATGLQLKRPSISNSNDAAPPLKRNPPRKICLMVEPTPFTHVSGYANRFNEMLKFLSKAGDEVDILTVDSKTPREQLPNSAFGYRIQHTLGFTFPLYNQISLTLDLPEMKGAQMLEKFKPDLIHVTSP